MVDDRLYTGWADGQLYRSTFDGTTFKPLRPVNLYGLAGFSNDIQSSHAMFYDRSSARVYFNQAGESGLYYRYFAPESGVVGAIRYRASAGTSAVNWASVRGTFLVGRTLYLTTARGRLQEVRWRRGELRGSVRTVSGPARDGHDWRARALFLEVR